MKRLMILLVVLSLVGCAGICKVKDGQCPIVKKESLPKDKAGVRQVQSAQAHDPEKEPANAQETAENKVFKAFVVYSDKNSSLNHFIPSGWMGDTADIRFNDAYGENPHSGKTCIRIEYLPLASRGARWAGIYWQYPQNNWGNINKSYNLTGATKLTFWAKGDKGNEQISEFKFGGISGTYPDSDSVSIGPITLTNEWKQYEIDLKDKNLTSVIGGFALSTNIDINPGGAIFYLDDIQYE